MRVQICLEGKRDLCWCEGEEWQAGDGASVVDEDCASAELRERMSVTIDAELCMNWIENMWAFATYILLY